MKSPNRGSRQGARRGSGRSHTGRDGRRNGIRRADSTKRSVSARRAAVDGGGKLDKQSALAALAQMGIAVDGDGPVDMEAARAVAQRAAVSAAKALGVDIVKADGSIDAAKARQAVGQVLGFSLERDGAPQQAEAAKRARQAAIQAAEAMGADIRDGAGNIDTAKARRVADLALDFEVAKAKKFGRREALDALNISLDAMTTSDPLSRRAASDAVEKLLSASVLVDGAIDGRLARNTLSPDRVA
jgi:hypothetical protein